MSLRLQLLVIVLLVGLVPLGISAWTTLSLHQAALEGRTTELHRTAARHGASTVEAHLERSAQSLSQAVRAISWDTLSEEERTGALWLLFKQQESNAVVTLLDGQGRGVGPSAYLAADDAPNPEFPLQPRASLRLLTEFSQRLPFEAARAGQLAFGEVFQSPGVEAPLIPLAVPVEGPEGATWVIATALSLGPLCQALADLAPSGATTYVIEPGRRLLCHPSSTTALAAPDEAVLAGLERPEADGTLLRFWRDGVERIAAVSRNPISEWAVVVEQDAAVAFAANARMRTQTLTWLGVALLFAVGAGLVLSRRILRPVNRLLAGASEIARGNYQQQLAVESGDELGKLSSAFNQMGAQVLARDQEIRHFNDQLQQRVEQRTRELREAQDQLLHSQKMAAVTGLGAGFAHEINNPLTSVLGLTQVLLVRCRKQQDTDSLPLLDGIQTEARRIRNTVKTLLSLSQNYAGEGFAEVDLPSLVEDALSSVQERLAQAQIEVVCRHPPKLPPVRGSSTQLRQVLRNLITNATAAMPQGGRLGISTTQLEGQAVRIEVSDTGRGIPPEQLSKIFDPFFTTKDQWRSEGLGLTVASRLVEQHNGRLQAHSQLGRGTTLVITLPAATATHLS